MNHSIVRFRRKEKGERRSGKGKGKGVHHPVLETRNSELST